MKKIMWKNIYVTFHIKAHKIGQLRAEYERTTSTYKKKVESVLSYIQLGG